MLVNLICFLAILFSANISWAQANIIRPDVIETKIVESNYIRNPSALKNMANITTSSATATRDTSAGNKIEGIASVGCDTSALNGYCEWSTSTIKTPDDSGNCAAYAEVKGDASLYRLVAVVSGVEVNQSAIIGNQTSFRPVTVNVPCGATAAVRVKQTEAGTSPAINVGRVSWGRATNLGQFMAGGQWVGSLRYATTANCSWSIAQSTFAASYSADLDCPTPTVSGCLVAPGTKIPGATMNNCGGAGRYMIVATGNFVHDSTSNYGFRFFDGTTGFSENAGNNLGVGQPGNMGNLQGSISYASPPGSLTIQVQGRSASSNSIVRVTEAPLEFNLYYYPDASLQAIRADQTNWGPTGFGAVPITATTTNPTKGTTTTDYITCLRSGANLECNWGLKQTVAGSAGSGTYLVGIPSATGCAIDTTKVPVSTTQRIANVGSAGGIDNSSTRFVYSAYAYDSTRIFLSGTYGLSGAGTSQGNEWSSSFIPFSNTSLEVSGSFKVPCVGWISNQGAPQLVNSVISSSQGVTKTEYVSVGTTCSASPCTISSQSGAVTSVTRSSAGNYVVNFATGTFSAIPTCVSTPGNVSGVGAVRAWQNATLTTYSPGYANNAGTFTDTYFDVVCYGPR